jgi:acetyl-CoA carboxylase biotin carboxyl carrier protein
MDIEKIKTFIDLVKENQLTELKYEEKDFKIAVSLKGEPVVANSYIPQSPVSNIQTTQPSSETKSAFHELKSPFVGTFYTSPAPDKPPFIKVGDRVSKGQTLCILEAMKIMNEIESDVDGEIVEVCVENESLVEFGQVLFRIKK